jgi:hypothetical protein
MDKVYNYTIYRYNTRHHNSLETVSDAFQQKWIVRILSI